MSSELPNQWLRNWVIIIPRIASISSVVNHIVGMNEMVRCSLTILPMSGKWFTIRKKYHFADIRKMIRQSVFIILDSMMRN